MYRWLILITTAALLSAPAFAGDLWFHLRVDRLHGENTKVVMNLPFSVIQKGVALMPVPEMKEAKLCFNGRNIDAAELRSAWRALASAPAGTVVRIDGEDHPVEFSLRGGYLLIHPIEGDFDGGGADVRIPSDIVEALLQGNGSRLNLRAAFQRIAAVPRSGDLLSVVDEDSTLRMWIDTNAEGAGHDARR